MATSNVDIRVGSSFDAKGFKQAESSISKLTKSVKYAAGTLGLALSAKAVVNFGKSAVKAFAEDQAAAAQLSNTLKNLGLSFADVGVKNFIDQLTLATGVADDQLRPAMQKLLQVTGSVVKSQELLKTALDISKGSGVDLATVSLDLANAYVGNTKGLKKYALGLTAAELKTASFDKILQAFLKNFNGAQAASLDTFAGKMGLINNALKEAKETIGSGLVDAFSTLAGDASFNDVVDKISKLAQNIGDLARGIGNAFEALSKMPIIHLLISLASLMLKIIDKTSVAAVGLRGLTASGARSRQAAETANAKFNPEDNAVTGYKKSTKAAAAAELEAKKRAKELIAAQTKQTAELKKQAALKKAGSVFDMQNAELLAALQGKLTEDEQNRVKALLAINNQNSDAATYYTNLVVQAQDRTGQLAQLIKDLPTAKDPFAEWNNSLLQVIASLKQIGSVMDTQYAITPASGVQSNYGGNFLNATGGYAGTSPAQNINLYIDGKQIQATQQDQYLNGNITTINRAVGDFARVTNS